jgi:hypothetical protein
VRTLLASEAMRASAFDSATSNGERGRPKGTLAGAVDVTTETPAVAAGELRIRVDTTVVPSNLAYPTDSGLLAKAVRRIAATGRRIHGPRWCGPHQAAELIQGRPTTSP